MARAKKTAMAEHSQETNKAEVCDICGDIGFSNAVLYCSECSETVVHQYCLGLDPKTVDDSYEWDCEYCSASKPSASTKSCGAFTQRSEGTCSEHSGSLKVVELEMTDDNFPYPKSKRFGCTRKGKTMKRKGAPLTSKNGIVVALGAECKRIRRDRLEDHSFSDRDKMEMILFDDQPPPLCILLPPVKGQRSSKHAEIASYGSQIAEWSLESASSWMDCPKEITRGIILLVTPSGEIVICTR